MQSEPSAAPWLAAAAVFAVGATVLWQWQRLWQRPLAPIAPEGMLLARDAAAKDSWLLHLKQCASDDSCAALYRSLQAPYTFLNHALADLEHRLMTLLASQGWQFFSLTARGSVITRTALRGGADLDVDIVLPVDLLQCRIPDIGSISNQRRTELFHAIAVDLWRVITAGTGFTSSQTETSITRSIKLVTKVGGTVVDVDLFPKILDQNGRLWAPLGKKDGRARFWSSVTYSQPMVKTDIWHEEQHLAVLLVKLWKAKAKQLFTKEADELEKLEKKKAMLPSHDHLLSEKEEAERTRLDVFLEQFDFPKGYHLTLAMSYLASVEPPRLLERGRVSALKVAGYVMRLAVFLAMAYDPYHGANHEYFFPKRERVTQPDVQPDGQQPAAADERDYEQPFLKDCNSNAQLKRGSGTRHYLPLADGVPHLAASQEASTLQQQLIQRLQSLLQAAQEWKAEITRRTSVTVPSFPTQSFLSLADLSHLGHSFRLKRPLLINQFTFTLNERGHTGFYSNLTRLLDMEDKHSILLTEKQLGVNSPEPHPLLPFVQWIIALRQACSGAQYQPPRQRPAPLPPAVAICKQWPPGELGRVRIQLVCKKERELHVTTQAEKDASHEILSSTVVRQLHGLDQTLNRSLLLQRANVGFFKDQLILTLPSCDQYGVDETLRPFIVLAKLEPFNPLARNGLRWTRTVNALMDRLDGQ